MAEIRPALPHAKTRNEIRSGDELTIRLVRVNLDRLIGETAIGVMRPTLAETVTHPAIESANVTETGEESTMVDGIGITTGWIDLVPGGGNAASGRVITPSPVTVKRRTDWEGLISVPHKTMQNIGTYKAITPHQLILLSTVFKMQLLQHMAQYQKENKLAQIWSLRQCRSRRF